MSTAKILTSYTAFNGNIIACVGDSYTKSYVLGMPASDQHPYVLQQSLRALGARVRCLPAAYPGDTSTMALARMSRALQHGVPAIGVLYIGANDPGASATVQSSPSPTATQFAVPLRWGTHYAVGNSITVGGVTCTVTAIAPGLANNTSYDLLTVSGLGGAPSVGATVSIPTIDTQANITAIGQALQAAGCSRLLVGLMHYLNYSSGGDTTGTPYAANVTLRTKQTAAAAALGAPTVDYYTLMRARIVAGTDTQGSYSWHVYDGNTHLNAYGQSLLAGWNLAAIQAQSGWLGAIS